MMRHKGIPRRKQDETPRPMFFPASVVAMVLLSGTFLLTVCSADTVVEPGATESDISLADFRKHLPAPGTFTAVDREDGITHVGRVRHTPNNEKAARYIQRHFEAIRATILGYGADAPDPEPRCQGDLGGSDEQMQESVECHREAENDPSCAVVVTEHFKESGIVHVHCRDKPS